MSTIRQISIASAMAAFAIILNLLSVRTDTSLYSIYALPLLLTGILFGPLIGTYAGFATGFVVQIVTYGLMPTTFLWLMAPISWGLISGLLSKFFHYKIRRSIIVLEVAISSFSALFLNSVGMILDGLYYQYPTEFVFTGLVLRIFMAIIVGIFYIFLLSILLPRLSYFRR